MSFEGRPGAYEHYRPVELSWLKQIPHEWSVKKLKFVARFQGGGTPSKSNLDYWNGDIPWVSPKDMTRRRIDSAEDSITQAGLLESAARMAPAGSVLLVVRSGILKHTIPVGLAQIPVALNQDMKAIVPNQGLDAEYLAWFVEGCQGAFLVEWRKAGATVESLEHELIASSQVPLPSLSEQRAITAFLDRETTRIDMLVIKKERLIDLLEEKRVAVISQAVTQGLDPSVPMKESGVEWIGSVPDNWAVAPLFARYSVHLGKMLDTKRITGDSLLPYLRNIDVQWDDVNVKNLPSMDIFPDEFERYTLRAGDLLVCEGGEVGRTGTWRGELDTCAYQKAIHRLRPKSGLDAPRYFYYAMRAAAGSRVFVAHGNPNTIPHLTAEQLRLYRFPFPPLEQQIAIAGYLDERSSEIDGVIAKVVGAIARLREYRTALITAAVTGEIDVRGGVAW